MLVISLDVSVYFISANISFPAAVITKIFEHGHKSHHCFKSQKASGWHFQSATRNIAEKKKQQKTTKKQKQKTNSHWQDNKK